MESFVLPSMAYVCMRDGKLCIAIHGICVYESEASLIGELDGKLCVAIHGICVYENEASPHRGVGWKALYCHPWHMCV